jgi:hypothetical protein
MRGHFTHIICNVQDYSGLYSKVVHPVKCEDILLTSRKHLYDRIIPLNEDVWAHKTSLTPPLFIELPVQNHESQRLCIFMLGYRVWPFQ